MEFYDFLSQYYDNIFPTSDVQVKFMREYAKGNVLDIGAGTAEDMIALAKYAQWIDGIEYVNKMAQIGRGKIEKTQYNHLNLQVGDMRNIKQLVHKSYDLITCTGNTLVHLENIQEITQVIGDIYSLIVDNGVFILQIVNYNRVLKYNIDHLPTIKVVTKPITFIRDYNYNQGKILFTGSIKYEDKLVGSSTIPLYPLTSEEIYEIISRNGFRIEGHYGSFNKDPYEETSMANIYVLRKVTKEE